jgi:hypothetical protein
MKKRENIYKTFVAALGLILMIWCMAPFSYADDSVTVVCYLGNPADNVKIGNLELFDPKSATTACNSAYNECRNNCTGCYIEKDGNEYCYDKAGNQFKR